MTGWGSRRKRARGLTMIEAAMVLGLMAIVMARVADMMAENARTVKENAAVGRMRQVIDGASKYVETNYSMLSTDTAAGGAYVAGGLAIPLADDVAAPAGLTSIQGGGFLPEAFAPTNPFGQREWLLVKRHPTVPSRIDMLVVTEGGEPLQAAKLPGIAARIGAAGGFVTDQLPYSVTDVTGSYGGWKSARSYWNSTGHTPEVGTLAASLAFETTPVADYLYRVAVPGHPEANRMFTDLDMAGDGTRHNITGAQDISTVSVTASGTVSAGDDLAATDDLTVGDDAMIGDRLTVNGQSAFARDASFGEDVSVTGNGTVGGTLGVTGETTSADFRIASVGGQRASQGIYYAGIHQHNDAVSKPACPGGMSPQVFVSPSAFSDAGTGGTISAVQATAASISAAQWRVRLRVRTESGWVSPTGTYGKIMVMTKCS